MALQLQYQVSRILMRVHRGCCYQYLQETLIQNLGLLTLLPMLVILQAMLDLVTITRTMIQPRMHQVPRLHQLKSIDQPKGPRGPHPT